MRRIPPNNALSCAAILAALALVSPWSAEACSFRQGFALFELSSTKTPLSGKPPAAPEVSFVKVKRGYDDGDGGSCSDAGILTIGLVESEAKRGVGYSLEVISGAIDDEEFFGNAYFSPIGHMEGGLGFYFVWLDGGGAIDAVIEIRSVSATGVVGDATRIVVKG